MARPVKFSSDVEQEHLFQRGHLTQPKPGDALPLSIVTSGAVPGNGTRILLNGMDITYWVQSFDISVGHQQVTTASLDLTRVEVNHVAP